MTRLHLPDVALSESWQAAMLEFGDEVVHGSGFWHLPEDQRLDFSPEACRAFVDQLLEFADHDRVLPEGMVHSDYYWIVDGEPAGGRRASSPSVTSSTRSCWRRVATSATPSDRAGDAKVMPRGRWASPSAARPSSASTGCW